VLECRPEEPRRAASLRLTVVAGGLSIFVYLVAAGGPSVFFRLSPREVHARPNSSLGGAVGSFRGCITPQKLSHLSLPKR
jgi:hypothetical protein